MVWYMLSSEMDLVAILRTGLLYHQRTLFSCIANFTGKLLVLQIKEAWPYLIIRGRSPLLLIKLIPIEFVLNISNLLMGYKARFGRCCGEFGDLIILLPKMTLPTTYLLFILHYITDQFSSWRAYSINCVLIWVKSGSSFCSSKKYCLGTERTRTGHHIWRQPPKGT